MEEIRIVSAQVEHKEQVINLLREYFVGREPICVSIGYSWDECGPGFTQGIGQILDEGHSFVALNSKEQVVGCRISTLKDVAPERTKDPEPDFSHVPDKSPKGQLLQSLFNQFMRGWTKEVPDSKMILEFVMMCVRDEYGGRGIGNRLVQRSLDLAQIQHVDYVYVIATNWKSQRVFEKLGFCTIRVKNYCEFLDEEGKELLKMSDGSTCMKWMVKKIG